MDEGAGESEVGESTAERVAKGNEVLSELSLGHPEVASGPEYGLVSGMEEWVTASLFGDVVGEAGSEKKVRSIATDVGAVCARTVATVKGTRDWALNLGWSREEVGELFMHLVYYCGLPACLNALGVAKEVFAERDAAN